MLMVTMTMLVMMMPSHELIFLKTYPVVTKKQAKKRPGGYNKRQVL